MKRKDTSHYHYYHISIIITDYSDTPSSKYLGVIELSKINNCIEDIINTGLVSMVPLNDVKEVVVMMLVMIVTSSDDDDDGDDVSG